MKKQENSFKEALTACRDEVAEAEARLRAQRIVERIWEKDFRVWGSEPAEIANRLGWLDCPETSLARADEIIAFVTTIRAEGFTNALLLGMGGSSLAAEVFSHSFAVKEGYLAVDVLDSTHPGAVLDFAAKLDPEKTLYIVSTKSGGTVETFSLMKFFYNQTLARVGRDKAGSHFIAITDPGSGLETAARQLGFRKIFLNDPNIGGRYAALSLFGIVPAALLGIDIREILRRAALMARSSKGHEGNTPARLGAIMGCLAAIGRDKITFFTSAGLASFADWLEQLIAESTGKEGKGILPLVNEELLPSQTYAGDRLFVCLRLQDDHALDRTVQGLRAAGQPLVEIVCRDIFAIGGEFFRWEMATAIAGWLLGIQPFNQPNVESAKVLAREMLAEFSRSGTLPRPSPTFTAAGLKVYADGQAGNSTGLRRDYFGKDARDFAAKGIAYIAIQAYMKPDEASARALQGFRNLLQERYRTAVSIGYGPRFLHSTGQLHKGDAGKGLFVQLLSRIDEDAPIPDQAGADKSSVSFATLITAQAFGDRQALLENRRRVVTFQFEGDLQTGFAALSALMAGD
ncbi:MAG: glucose-6-phosphate isomerase [Candidatus Aminicenantes bacterium]|nr:glucose-6-phosphate isomerase [Candidatus Aminicenantes bacterium]